MLITEFDFELPEDLIAQEPLAQRQDSRMLVVDRASDSFRDSQFADFPGFINENDVVVLNNTRVFPARLFGASETGAKIELFLVRELEAMVWETLARPARRLKPGKKIVFGENLTAEVLDKTGEGRIVVEFTAKGDFDVILEQTGQTPLPPYIKREEGAARDRERYQTVFARERGAIAAPTAGLHFTPRILRSIEEAGATLAEVTLHVGYGTFEPVRVNDLSEHKVLPENYSISAETAELLTRAKMEGRRIVAVGTTTTRTLETAYARHGRFVGEKNSADLTITPGFKFGAIDALLTNFHLPQSSLLVLVSTFGGHKLIMDSYRHAVAERYRFYSYGDCMLIV
jgi:S-adenosylmethionine:tRNA ribosyltransferase-isomerase